VHITDEAADQLRGVTVEAGDVLLNITGDSILRTCVAPAEVLPARVSQHVAIIRSNGRVDPGFMQKWLSLPAMKHFMLGHSSGGTRKAVTKGHILSFPIPLPPLREQHGISETLGALDGRIASNRKLISLLRNLGLSWFDDALNSGSKKILPLAQATISISRGVAPRYADDDPLAPQVLNQKCIRDGWVSLGPARRMIDREVSPGKKASSGDVLVNSTGTGTLGRVGRWHSGDIFVDGHVTVVKANVEVVPPTILAYALFGRESDVVALATGSTGQTELSPTRLGSLDVTLPASYGDLEVRLLALENKAAQLFNESHLIEKVRDELLPYLLSGRIRVREAEKAVAGVIA
jgi:type I restriction enzyme S subunit